MKRAPGNLLLGRQRKDSINIEQIKKKYRFAFAWLTGKGYRPFTMPLEELRSIWFALQRGGSHE